MSMYNKKLGGHNLPSFSNMEDIEILNLKEPLRDIFINEQMIFKTKIRHNDMICLVNSVLGIRQKHLSIKSKSKHT